MVHEQAGRRGIFEVRMILPLGAKRGLITSLGCSVQRPAAGGWWLSGGIAAANCIAAYQPKGAASYAASLMDLSVTGNDAYEGIAPTWDATNGWTFNGTYFLKTGIIPTTSTVFAIKYANCTDTWWAGLFGVYNNAGNTVQLGIFPVNSILNAYNCGLKTTNGGTYPTGTVIILNKDDLYVNGTFVVKLSSTTYETADYFIGGFHRIGYDTSNYRGGHYKCHAFANYTDKLTAEQVSALTTAMNAL